MLKILLCLLTILPLYAADEATALNRAERFATAKAENVMDITKHEEILRHVQKAINEVGAENILVCFDIDDCITYPDHPAASPHNFAGTHKTFFESVTDPLPPTQSSVFWNLQYVEPNNRLTDDEFPLVLEQLHAWNIRTIGLTASLAGILHHPTPNCIRRVEFLETLGIHFKAPEVKIVMEEFPLFHDSHPIYYNGVAFAQSSMNYGSSTKGDIIMALTKRWGHKPAIVFMVDDSIRNLHQVYKVLKDDNGIECRSFRYRSDRVHENRDISATDYEAFVVDLLRKTKVATGEKKEQHQSYEELS